MSDNWYEELASLLQSRGHSEDEIKKIMERVKQHDIAMMHDSVMDSIASGHFNLAKIIEEALAENQ